MQPVTKPRSTRPAAEPRKLPIVRESAPPLAEILAQHVRGEVRFDDGSRALYAADASNYRQVPIGVVVPRDLHDVIETVSICRDFGAPIVHRGGGTSLAGQGCNAAVLIDFSKYCNQILELDPERRSAYVQPGVVLDDLRNRAEAYHLTFAPDPATHNHCTLGGMIGNNSCGMHSMMGGTTADNVEELDVLTYDGLRLTTGATSEHALDEIIRAGGRRGELYRELRSFRDRHADAIRRGFPNIPRRVSGYNLPALLPENGTHVARTLVGSESTLVTVLGAKLRLVPSPPARALLVLGYPSIFEAADHLDEVLAQKPIALEGVDQVLVEDIKKKGLHPERVKLLPDGCGWLLVELGGSVREEAEAHARALMARLGTRPNPPSMKLFEDPGEEKIVWKVRESGLGATARVPGEPDTWEGWEDSSVPPERLGSYLRRFHDLLDRYGFRAALYGHFGQGCLHTRIPFGLRDADGIAQFRSFVEDAADLVVEHGGSLSGEHGDGQSRAELLPKMFAPELMRAFEELKAIWDPSDKMNPGKIVRPYRLDENLRFGADYRPAAPATHFRFPEDDGLLSRAVERCVGVGECRRTDHGTMCPSYMVTREEQHSTRGRAHLLFELLRGDAFERFGKAAWRNDPVREALGLCLACKGCKSDCPVSVDMATYKAEFLSHYYEGRLRPRSAYAFGLIYWWARLAALAPGLVNAAMRAPVLSSIMKWAAGVDPRRTLPAFAPVTFTEWWRARPPVATDRPRSKVVLWVDTFNNHWQPAVPIAAVEALEDAGYQVVVPPTACCGRPLYDYGMLRLAKRMLRQVLETLRPAIRAGAPIIGLEPSCLSVFRDELVNMYPDDPDARRLAQQSHMLGDFLLHHTPGWTPPRLVRKALVQGHCHDKSVLSYEDDKALFDKLELDAESLDAGCCGMAGAFGYEREHYDVSVACGERRLVPSIRDATDETIVIADGFSCREQIRQETQREALHTAQVLQMARREGPLGPTDGKPERRYVDVPLAVPRQRRVRNAALGAVGLGLALAGAYALLARRR